MIEINKLEYRLIALDPEGTQYDLTAICDGLTWSEAEKELGAKINFKCAAREELKNIQPLTPIIICADTGDGFKEVIRGSVQKLSFSETNSTFNVDIEAADEAQALRQSQEDYYFAPESSSESILEKILSDAGVEYKIEIESVKHGKKVYRARFLSDMIQDILKDLKEKGGGEYFLRAKEGVLEIIPRGTNETIYHFDISQNISSVKENFDSSKLVTKVKVVGKETSEGHQHVDSIIEGNTELGVRQRIYRRSDKETLEEAEKAAKKILDEQGSIERKTTIEAADIPHLRKGDRIRVRSSLGEGYFFISSIRHNAAQKKMTLQLDEDKDKNKEAGLEFDTAFASSTKDD